MSQPHPSDSAALIRAQLQARKLQQASSPAHKKTARHPHTAQQWLALQQLAGDIRQLESAGHDCEPQHSISTGCAALDACLPRRGYAPGSVVEYLRTTPACGASHLAFAAAASAMRARDGFLVIASTQHETYPPALLSHGISLEKTIFVRPDSQSDLIWSVDQSLRTPAVVAVVAEFEVLDDRAARRLQLAAEHGQCLGLLVRGIAARRSPSWAEVQWIVKGIVPTRSTASVARHRELNIRLARVRGGQAGASLRLEINPTTGEITRTDRAVTTKAVGIPSLPQRNQHEQDHSQQAAVRLATELAGTTRTSRRAKTG